MPTNIACSGSTQDFSCVVPWDFLETDAASRVALIQTSIISISP